ncbi:hypothetical protein ACP3T3_20430 [Chryseobacterium sp. CBSDS_008]|uniref:hypothetical protein n=1 Tax=Chryseobacterium sp. CBSDS_008 TaxID=3415265 RepID=UPI003CED3CBA
MIITKLHVIDWYDDIITSIVSFDNNIYIFNCIHKNFINGLKTYYCVKIDDDSSKQIGNIIEKKSLTKIDWNFINMIFKKNNKTNNVFLFNIDSLFVGLDIIFSKARSSDIIDIKFPFDISNLY